MDYYYERSCAMVNKKLLRPLILCTVLFALALLISLLFAAPGEAGTVRISEVVASNRTSPAPNGQYLDYIEVQNTGSGPVDISGYMLSDKPDTIGYTFPQDTVLPAGGYAVCWCDKNAGSESYAAFGISNDGTDTVYLYNSANVVVDRLEVPIIGTNVPYIRQADGAWGRGTYLTPGFENTEAGYAAWLRAGDAAQMDVVISEIMPGANCLDADGTGRVTDWVELWNRGDTQADLTGGYLTDDPGDIVKWQLPELILQPGDRVVIRCAGDEARAGEADFLLSRDGGTVLLSGKLGQPLSRVEYGVVGRDISWALTDGTYAPMEATPGFENSESGYHSWLKAVNASETNVVISEIMAGNYSTVLNAKGQLCDWVELYNPGTTAADLSGCYLSNDPDHRGKWRIEDLTLMPGEYTVILCSGTDASPGEASFGISRDGATVLLTGKAGNVLCSTTLPAMERDHVWALQNGSYAASIQATPGLANTEANREAWLKNTKPTGALIISEVMPSNSVYYMQADGKCYDWVELYNASDETIQLSDYYLSNDPDRPQLFHLPQQELKPGQYLTVICSGDAPLTGSYIYAPFTLSRQQSFLYVTGPDGSFSDHMGIWDVPSGCSVGRSQGTGTYYFTKPTPAKANGTGVVFISPTPNAVTAAGVYNGVSSLSVELSGEAVRYTTDGSIPTARSKAYEGPISLTETTVLRFASFADGRIPSDVVTAAYIINENHTLPVVSMATTPSNLFSPTGLYEDYESEDEVPCNITLFEEGGGFTVDCGLKMYGHMGLTLPKKSFKINFRGQYGTDLLTYPVFGADGPQIYDSLVIRSGQDYTNTIFRDELFTSLCREASDSVLAQRDKHVILYINGEYWGIYTIKEAFGQTMYAENYGVTADSVTVQQAPVGTDSELFALVTYCRRNDLSVQENYEYFASRMDIDSLIDWMIFEAYGSNTDIAQNLRYFKSTENGDKWQFALYDLDWAWYFKDGFFGLLSPERAAQHITLGRAAFQNPEFRQKFFTRLAELKNGVLSNEHVLNRIDHYVQLLSPEVAREKVRWGGNYTAWEKNLEKMRSYITGRDHWAHLEEQLRRFVGMTDEEYNTYLGG